jgi:outer membrane protein TolC
MLGHGTGLTNFQNVLDTERSLSVRQDELGRSEGDVTLNLIRVYRSLGGGWSP